MDAAETSSEFGARTVNLPNKAHQLALTTTQAALKGVARRKHRVAILGNFPPRRCGIATFTADVFASLETSAECMVIAMREPDDTHEYGAPVSQVIRQNAPEDYLAAARTLNASGVDVVSIQHEFGIFGGVSGEYLLLLLDALKCAVVTTLHTVLKKPNDDQCRVLSAILRRSSRVIVMSDLGRSILIDRYNARPEQVIVVPHGAPDRPYVSPDSAKALFGFDNHEVLLTFGLLSPNKGIESMIRALPEITRACPRALYVILGATHPHQRLRDGENYRESLRDLATDLGVADNVRFIDKYVDQEELLDYLTAADIYITPYLNPAQITSGTLSYAVALGKPVVSTPYWHAEELLADGIGDLVPFGDTIAMARAVSQLLVDRDRRETLAKRAYARGRDTIWSRSGAAYLAAFQAGIREHAARAAQHLSHRVVEPNFAAIARMSDDCGMFQHAKRSVPDRTHGYCIDDTARALILVLRGARAGIRMTNGARRMESYAAFVEHAWNPDVGRFRNFMSYDRIWLEARGSEDSTGRAVWCLGETARLSTDAQMRQWALDLAARVVPALHDVSALRASAFCILGLNALLEADPSNALYRTTLSRLAAHLHGALMDRKPGWTWFEQTLTYDNARLPEALLVASASLGDPAMRQDALDALRWLVTLSTGAQGECLPAGNRSFHIPFVTPARFDQQPLEAAAMIDACVAALAETGDPVWSEEAARAHAWYSGANVGGASLRAPDGAGCYDGLGEHGPNHNQGAESLLALQFANCAIKTLIDSAERVRPVG